MDRNGLSRILLVVALFFLGNEVYKMWRGPHGATTKAYEAPETFERVPLPPGVQTSEVCAVATADFHATVESVGGGVRSFRLLGPKYVENGQPIDVARATSIDMAGNAIPEFTPLRTYFRNSPADDQVPGDLVVFKVKQEGDSCVLTHTTPGVVSITRTIRPTAHRYELSIETTIENLASTPKRHAFSTSLFALQKKADEGGMLKRPSANSIFQAACAHDGKVERKDKGKLKDWFIQGGDVDFAALTTNYLGQALIPLDNGSHCALRVDGRGGDDANEPLQSLFRAAIAYPSRELAPGGKQTYRELAYLGPKERDTLAAAADGNKRLAELVDLGTFSPIARVLVRFLTFVHGQTGSWGLAIVLMTLSIRLALTPLTLAQLKSSVRMRRLKPEIDIINAKFADDAQAKMLATQALHKKHGINPLAGCLPALLQMPIWLALYSALQTAIELYHEHFFIWKDLSAPDPYFALPLILGASMFIQQKVTPVQMDPAQAKLMMYFMPAMFTVFMLFLPAGLALYSLTNSVLAITQTVLVERYTSKQLGPPGALPGTGGGSDVKVVERKGDGKGGKSQKSLAQRNEDAKA